MTEQLFGSMSSMYDNFTCPECQGYKKEEYDMCYMCAQETAYQAGKICECGNYKKPEFKLCYDCARSDRDCDKA